MLSAVYDAAIFKYNLYKLNVSKTCKNDFEIPLKITSNYGFVSYAGFSPHPTSTTLANVQKR